MVNRGRFLFSAACFLALCLSAFAQTTPIVNNVSPASGTAGTQVTFTGAGFGSSQGSGNVWLGSTYGAVVSWSDSQVVATVASGSKSGTAQILQDGAWSGPINFTVITPVVSSVTPTSGTAGTQVTFIGTGFGATQGSGNVWLGSTYGTVVSWSDTQIVATVASGSKSGTAQILQGGVWSDVINFTLTTPKVTSVTPTSGIAGTQVTFTGSGFGATQGSGNVWLGSTYGTVVSWSDSQVVATVASGAKSGTAQILQGGVWSDVINFSVVTPVVSSVTPTSGIAGTQVTFTGSGFGATQGNGNVWLGSTYGTVTSWSDTQVVATVASGAKSGTAQILQGGVWSDPVSFSVVTPVVSSVTPTLGIAGTQVTFTGSGFGANQGNGNVWLGSTYGTVVSWSDTQVIATVASGAKSGTAQVLQGGVWSDPIIFTVNTPQVTSVTPVRGQAGTQVTFQGSNFGATQGSGNVWLGNNYGTVVSWSDTQVVATVAAGAASGTAQILQGGVWSDPVNFAVNTTGPLLQFSVADSALQVNLSSPQNLDWIHWGRVSATLPDRKGGITPLISDYTPVNGPPSASAGNIGFSWTDEYNQATVSETIADVETFNAGGGFQITVPADTSVKTLNLYVEVFTGQGQLQATLSDGSAPAVTDQSVIDADVASKVYSIDFRAGSSNQTLTVTFTSLNANGGVGLQAATLTQHLPVVSITSPAVGQSSPAPGTIQFNATATQFDYPINGVRATGSDGTVLDSPASPLNANWGPLAAGHYSITATATDSLGLTNTSAPVETDVIGQGGSLSIEEAAPSSPIDLDAQGTGDWVLWGPVNTGDFIINNPGNVLARKSGVASLISDYKPIGNHGIYPMASAHSLQFTAASQTLFSAGSELAVFGLNDGFEITVPADTTPRTLQLYSGVISGDLSVTAFLSDGSAPVAIETGGGGGPSGPPAAPTTLYNINYSAASSGQTLTVRLTLGSDQGGGQAILIGAALNGPPVAPPAPAPHITAVNPVSAPANAQVTIAGTNFGATQGSSGVLFGQLSPQVVSWSDTGIVVTVPAGLGDGYTVHVVVVTANGTSNQVSFTTPNYKLYPSSLSLVVGQSAIVFPQDSRGNIVTGLTWSAKDSSVVNLSTDDPPVITAIAPGTTTVYAGYVTLPVNVSSTSSPLVSINIGPQNPQVALGFSQTFFAAGIYADGHSQDLTSTVAWSSLTPSIVTINSAGQASGVQIGTATIQASVGSVSGSTSLIVQPSSLRSLIVAPAIPGMTVGGSQAFTATGVYADNSTQDLTGSVSWSSLNPSVATINTTGLATGTGSGRTLIVAALGSITKAVTLTVTTTTTLPTITVQVSPPANSQGWNNLSTTVAYTCTPGSSPIVSCPAAQVVTTEGTGQVFSGTVTDAVGNTATASVTLNVDRTKPALAVTSLTDGAVVATASLTVSGTVSDSLSGLDYVTCNGSVATVSAGNFSCDISLNPGLNLLLVRANDLAGNVAASIMHVTLNAPLPAPGSLQITPATVNMLIGDTQRFTAVDQLGRPRLDATWSISDTSLAALSTDAQPILTAVALGQPILTATVGSVSAQVPINIVPAGVGGTLPVGTPRWSVPPASGFSPALVVQAEPLEGAPDLYSVEKDASGNLNVRAMTADGQQLWTTPVITPSPGVQVVVAGDANGGLLLTTRVDGGGFNFDTLIDLDAQTGTPLWSHDFVSMVTSNPTQPAIGDDGTLYFWEQVELIGVADPALLHFVALDGLTGTAIARYQIPLSTDTAPDGSPGVFQPELTDPVIDSNGTVWAGYTVLNATPHSYEQTLNVLAVASSGDASQVTFQTFTGGDLIGGTTGEPFQVIPNGQDGVLVSWAATSGAPRQFSGYHVSNVSADGSSSDFTFANLMNNMVLGENGVAYADGSGGATAFDVNSGATLWTYPQPLNVVGPLADDGLIVNTNLGLVSLDSSGVVGASLNGFVVDPSPLASDSWTGIINGSFSLFAGPSDLLTSSLYSDKKGNDRHQRRSSSCTLTANSDTPLADEAKDNIQRSFSSVHDGGISFVTGTADLYVTNTTFSPPDLPAGTLGLDNVLSNHVKFSSGNIYKAKPKGATGAQALSAGGVVIAHEFGHYLLQCVHFPTDWSPTKVYSLNDLVKYKGQFYSSLIFLNGGLIPNVPDISPKAWALFTLPPTVSDCGNEGIMRPGEMHGNELWHTDFGPGNDFTTNQALAIQKKCRKLHPPRKKP